MEGDKMEKGRVCVTGGTGFFASWLIKRLLEDGYYVNTTIRPSSDRSRNIDYLKELPGASEGLQIFKADLDNPDSFDAAIEGCTGVFHVAHPIDFEGKETEEAKVKKSINGTIGILQSCLNSKMVKRVVYTSSAATVVFNDDGLDVMDESIWSDVDYVRRTFGDHGMCTYAITKILTEKAAFEFAEEHGLDLVSIIPTWIHGPFVCPFLPESVRLSMLMIFGYQDEYKNLLRTSLVHTDDLARAHVFLYEHPNAKGRYICSSVDITIDKLAQCLSARYPDYPIPTADSLKDITGYKSGGVSSNKLLDTGFEYKYGIGDMFDAAIQGCKEKGFLEKISGQEGAWWFLAVGGEMRKGRVCVTGGTGFFASWLIKRLLEDGYSVNTTIRSSSDRSRNVDYVRELVPAAGASEKLEIFNADLDNPDSFDAAIEGCIGVFHVAHPMDIAGGETEETKIKRSVNGMIGILESCQKSKTVKRVVYTSSGSTVTLNDKGLDIMDESIWSDVDCIRRSFGDHGMCAYAITKMLTEKAALEFAENHGLDLVTVIPTMIHGPFVCPFWPGSVRVAMALILGYEEWYKHLARVPLVHTDDLARAHIFLFEYPKAKGRYICSAVEISIDELARCLSARYPEYAIPNADSLKDIKGFKYGGVSSKKLLDTGFEYQYGIQDMFDAAIRCCKEKGFL